MKWTSSRGSAHMSFLGVLFVALLVVAALFSAKFFVERENVQKTYYPDQEQTTGVSITGTTGKSPVGVSVGTSGSVTTTKKPAPVPQQGVVTYTDSGFSPQTVTIGRGKTVMFSNKSTKKLSILSETSIYSDGFAGFSPELILDPGQATTFVFPDVVRTYKYYNRLNTAHRGTIVVQ